MKISIIGIGRVGSTLAYNLALKGICDELILVHHREKVALGDAYDLQHGMQFLPRPTNIRAGGISDTQDSEIIAVCASMPTNPDMKSRMELASGNVELFKNLIPPLVQGSPNAKFIIVSNPVDVLTYLTIKCSGLPASQVMGTGTLIDSARFRSMLSHQVGIHPNDLRAYILGEHGASQFPAFSVAEAGGEKIEDNQARRELFKQVIDAGFKVLRYKGYTNYAIALATSAIIESIVLDSRSTMPLSVLIDGYFDVSDVCLSLPVVVGRQGVTRQLRPQLNAEEAEQFRNSARTIRSVLDELKIHKLSIAQSG